MNKVLLSPSSFGQLSSGPIELLKTNGFEIIENPFGRRLTELEVKELLKDCVGLVAGVEPLTSEVLRYSQKLKCISRVGVGIDNIDLDTAKELGISVVNTPDGPTQAVAEFTLGLTLSLLRKIPVAHKNLSGGLWRKETGNLLKGKTIGIIGLGRIGRKVAEMFRALGNEVIGFDIIKDMDWAKQNGVRYVNLKNILANADIITVHVPYDTEKGEFLGLEEFKLMKRGAFLINVSRGKVVNENVLKMSLDNGQLSGAAVDVFEEEPYSGELLLCENIILTPHIGSYAREGKINMEMQATHNLINALKTSER